ncbi:MAG: choice-of-anchor I family protein [Ruminococcus sp.]
MKKSLMKKILSTAMAAMLTVSTAYTGAVTVSAAQVNSELTGSVAEEITGYENETAQLKISKDGSYVSGMTNPDGGVMEIVDYNVKTGWAYSVNGQVGCLTAIPVKDIVSNSSLNGTDIDIKALVEAEDFVYGDMTSVAVSPDGTTLAVAIQSEDFSAEGKVAIFNCNEDGTIELKYISDTGVQPDMITYTPDGSKIITANEGEPRLGYSEGTVDPMGSVTVINAETGESTNADFTSFDNPDAQKALTDAGIILKKATAPSVDFEPEYIAATNTTAYVSLQEANAVAVLDIETNTYKGVYSAGFEDYSKVPVDIDKKDETYSPKTYDSLRGIRMPDGISLVTVGGTDYLLTANEGDSREWAEYLNEDERNFGKDKTSPTGKITPENSGISGKVVFFDSSDYNGLDSNLDYLFGGRTFTMFKVTDNGLQEVFTSGCDFEKLTSEYIPLHFNCSNDDITIDDRSGKKGPEPESVTVGTVKDKTYAFVALERIGGVMVYDITDPANVKYTNYINSRDFSADIAGDDSPEGLCFISAEESPAGKPLLLTACEVSGSVAVYGIADIIQDITEPITVAVSESTTSTTTETSSESSETTSQDTTLSETTEPTESMATEITETSVTQATEVTTEATKTTETEPVETQATNLTETTEPSEVTTETKEPTETEPIETQPTQPTQTQSTTQATCQHSHTKTAGTKQATYFAKGYTGDKICNDCGKKIFIGKEIPKEVLKTPKVTIKPAKKAIKITYKNVIKDAKGLKVTYKLGKKTYKKKFTLSKKELKKAKITKTIKVKPGKYKITVNAFVTSGKKVAFSASTKAKKVKVK